MRRREEQVNACAKRRLCRRKELAFGQRKVRLTPRNGGSSLRMQLFALRSTLRDGHGGAKRRLCRRKEQLALREEPPYGGAKCGLWPRYWDSAAKAALHADKQSALRDGAAVNFAWPKATLCVA